MMFALMIDGQMGTPSESILSGLSGGNPISWVTTFGGILTWNYSWIPGDWALLRFALGTISVVFLFLLGYEALQVGSNLLGKILGRG